MATPAAVAATPVTVQSVPKRRRLRFVANPKAAIGLTMMGIFVLLAIIGPWISPYNPSARSNELVGPPSAAHWLGTTHLGQDILSQLLSGTRSVILVGLLAGVVASILSLLIGVTSGYLSGTGAESLSALS